MPRQLLDDPLPIDLALSRVVQNVQTYQAGQELLVLHRTASPIHVILNRYRLSMVEQIGPLHRWPRSRWHHAGKVEMQQMSKPIAGEYPLDKETQRRIGASAARGRAAAVPQDRLLPWF
jgi:hypothetical protein